jgi:hypothetical protein
VTEIEVAKIEKNKMAKTRTKILIVRHEAPGEE